MLISYHPVALASLIPFLCTVAYSKYWKFWCFFPILIWLGYIFHLNFVLACLPFPLYHQTILDSRVQTYNTTIKYSNQPKQLGKCMMQIVADKQHTHTSYVADNIPHPIS